MGTSSESSPASSAPIPGQELHLNSKKDLKPNKFEDFGYFFYPERFGNVYKPAWYDKFFSTTGTTDAVNKLTCEKNVQKAIETRWFLPFLSTKPCKRVCNLCLFTFSNRSGCKTSLEGYEERGVVSLLYRDLF